jgi:hypothetical protein
MKQYDRQLVAGYSRNQPDQGLVVVMPDLDDVERGVRLKDPEAPGSESSD